MKSFLYIIIFSSALLSSFLVCPKVKIPRDLIAIKGTCPFNFDMAEIPVMVVRIIDNSSLPHEFKKKCLLSAMNEKNGVLIINRENEPQILRELAHQSEIPTSLDHVQPIGEILIPSHLYVVNQVGTSIEFSLSEIRSGKYVWKEDFQYSGLLEILRNNIDNIYRGIISFITFLLTFSSLRIGFNPVFKWATRREKIISLNKKFQAAQDLIDQNNVYAAGDLLLECVRSPTDCPARNKAISILSGLSKFSQGA